MPRVLVSLKTIERSVVMLSRASIPGPSGKVYLLVGLQERVYQEVSGFHYGFEHRGAMVMMHNRDAYYRPTHSCHRASAKWL